MKILNKSAACCGLFVVCMLFGFSWLLPRQAACEDKPLWELGVGTVVLGMPDYRGADEGKLYVLPYPYFVYRGDILKVDEKRISGQIFKTDRILLDISANGSVPVDSDDNAARAGMPDLDPTFEIGPALRVLLTKDRADGYSLSLSFPLCAVFSTDFSSVCREGWLFHPRINLEKKDIIPNSGINMGISAGPMFGSKEYHAYFYDVETAYVTPTRPAYSSSSGYSGFTVTLGLNKPWKQLLFNAFVSADFLHGAVYEDSPLVKKKTSVMGGCSVAWIFMKSDKLVPSER